MNKKLFRSFYLALLIFVVGCAGSHLRGDSSKSPDAKTYLIIEDDNGGHCGGIYVDGKEWPYKIGEKEIINPGVHTIECGGRIEFEIEEGKTFRFNYWGP